MFPWRAVSWTFLCHVLWIRQSTKPIRFQFPRILCEIQAGSACAIQDPCRVACQTVVALYFGSDTFRSNSRSPLLWIMSFDFSLNGLYAWFCLKSTFNASRFGRVSNSINFLTASLRAWSSCSAVEYGSPWNRESIPPRQVSRTCWNLHHNSSLLRIGQFEHGWVICKEEVVPRRDFSIAWILTLPRLFCTFEHFDANLEEINLIQHCKTSCCYRTTSPSTSTTVEAPTTCTPSSNQDWFWVEKISRKVDRRYSSQQWILCIHIYTSSETTTWRVLELQCTKWKNTPEYNVLGQLESCSEEGSDVLSNEI